MAHLLTSILLCLSILVKVPSASSGDKVEALYQLSKESEHGLIKLSLPQYQKFIANAQTRPFNFIVLFVSDGQYCKVCPNYQRMIQHVAESFRSGQSVSQSDASADSKKLPVFVGIVEIGSAPAIVKLHALQQIPMLVHFGKTPSFTKTPTGEMLIKQADTYPIIKADPPAQEVLDWINTRCGSSVKLYFSKLDRFLSSAFVFASIAAFITFVIFMIGQVRKRRWVLVTIPLIIQYFSTSGIFFNIMQGMNWTGPDGSWVMRYGRGQFLAEGLSMSAVMSLSGMSLLLAVRLPQMESVSKSLGHQGVSIAMIALAGAALVGIYVVLEVYKLKTGWYQSPPFFPPEHFKRGPLKSDQGNVF